MSHRVHTHTDRTTKLLIFSNVHYVHLGGDNTYSTAMTAVWLTEMRRGSYSASLVERYYDSLD